MSDGLQSNALRERLTGKWQIPSFGVAVTALVFAILTYKTPIDKIPFDRLRAELPQLVAEGRYTAAIEMAGVLFLVPDKTVADLADIHASLGHARLLRAVRGGVQSPSIGRSVVEHFRLAAEGGHDFSASDHESVGRAYDWSRRYEAAVEHYDAAIALSRVADMDLRWRSARLHSDEVGTSVEEMHKILGDLIRDGGNRPDILAWALEHEIDYLGDEGRLDEANELLTQKGRYFESDRWGGWHAYLAAYVMYREGRYDEVEGRLRLLRDGLGLRDELHARTGWMLGRVVLGVDGGQRPIEAMSFFQDAMSIGLSPVYSAAAELGLAESLVSLERFDEALERYAGVLGRMKRLAGSRHLSRAVIESSLTVVSERLRQAGRAEAALRFARTALTVDESGPASRRFILMERLSDLLASVARGKRAEADALASGLGPALGDGEAGRGARGLNGDQSHGTGPNRGGEDETRGRILALRNEARVLFLESGDYGARVAAFATGDADRATALAWRAVERVNESGDLRAIVETMGNFMVMHPGSSYVPRALRYQGQALQSLGRLGEAVDVYQSNLRRFPRTPDAGASMIPLARCYMGMGKKYADLAEKSLRLVLDDSDVFTPMAPEYADALFLLGELLNRSGAYERAVPELEEAMERYPNDARTARARFLLGDCYRQSALALSEDSADASFAAQRQRIQAEQRERLRQAADLFARTVEDFDSRGVDVLDGLDQVYLRHARLYWADCHFELGEYGEALSHYERAGWVYKDTTSALSAYVQIINCHVFMGNGADAAAALRRALYLVDTMPAETFAADVGSESRADWRSYFEWVQKSDLF